MLAPAVGRVLEPHRRRRLVAAGAVIANVDPQPTHVCFLAPATQRTDRRVVAVDLVGLQHVAAHGFGQRRQQRAAIADHVGDGRATHLDTITTVDLAQPVQRHVIGELAHHDVCEQPGAGHAPIHRAGRRQRLRDRLATRAGQLRPNVAHHMEGARLVVQNLRDVLADFAQGAAAGLAAAAGLRRVNDSAARQVRWQLAQPWPASWRSRFLRLGLERRHVATSTCVSHIPASRQRSTADCRDLAADELGVVHADRASRWSQAVLRCATAGTIPVRPSSCRWSTARSSRHRASAEPHRLQCSVVAHKVRERHGHDLRLPAATILRNRDLSRQPIALSTTPPCAVATCALDAASRCLRAASRAAPCSARRSRCRPAARRSDPSRVDFVNMHIPIAIAPQQFHPGHPCGLGRRTRGR